jgi:hypothetical protein
MLLHMQSLSLKTMKLTLFPLRLFLVLTVVLLAICLPAQAAKQKRTTKTETLTFQVATNARIAVGTNRSATLSDLKIGDHVVVAYEQENGALVARRIGDDIQQKSPASKNQKENQRRHRRGTQNLLHARGVLESVDSRAGTLTIAVRPHARR